MKEEAPKVSSYLDSVIDDLDEKQDQINDGIWGIEDTQQVWENQIDKINLKLHEKAIEWGIEKEKLKESFCVFNITDMVKQASECEYCS